MAEPMKSGQVNSTAPVTPMVIYVKQGEHEKLRAEVIDLRSRIEAIEGFRNPAAIEGKINELFSMLENLGAKKVK